MSGRKSFALIGVGMVAKTHVLAAAGAGLWLKAVLGRDLARTQAFAQYAGDVMGAMPDALTDIDQIAKDPEIGFAVIVTPPNARLELVQPLALAGKHILLEKPIGRTSAEAMEIIETCAKAGVKLGVVLQHRMRAVSQKAADLVASGAFGALGLAEIIVPWWRDQAYYDQPGRGSFSRDGGGVLISQAIHTIDLALSLTGPVASVQAMAATTIFHTMEGEDFVAAGLRFQNGAVGSLVASTASFPGAGETITLHFQNASLLLAAGQLTVTWRDGRIEHFGAPATSGGGADPMAFTHEWHQGILTDFVDAIDQNRSPIVDGVATLPAHALIDAIQTSAKTGKTKALDYA